MAWRLFNWGSRGATWDAGRGVYVATILIPRCIQITLFGHDKRGSELLHSFHARAEHDPPTLPDCTLAATAVATWASAGAAAYITLLHNDTFIDRVVATSIAELEGPQAEVIVGEIGTLTTAPLPSEVSLALKKSGTTRGRSKRGRFFVWPGVVAHLDATDPNLFDTSYVDAAVHVFNTLVSAMAAAGEPLVIGSQVRGQMYDVAGIVATDHLVDGMSRRKAGRGR